MADAQTVIPCTLMRGGTSKGAYFLSHTLPADEALRERVLLAVMGSPDERQIDGLGGANPLTSKVAMVGPSAAAGADVDYLFAQVVVDRPIVDLTQNCGNILAGVGPFAVEKGLVAAGDPLTKVAIHMVNSGKRAIATVETPGGVVQYAGGARIAGVPGSAAPVLLDFLDTAGSACGALLPTGNARDLIDGIPVTCIDNGMPVVVVRAKDLGRSGYETREALDRDEELKARLEAIRLQAGAMMKLGDVGAKTVPKMTLVAAPRGGGAIATRTFIPHRCHASIGVLGAVSVATACLIPGAPAAGLAQVGEGATRRLAIEHPSGDTEVEIEVEAANGAIAVKRSALLRTARKIFDGAVFVPSALWDGRPA